MRRGGTSGLRRPRERRRNGAMNRQPYQSPPRWWSPTLRPWWIWLLRPVRRRVLRRQLRIDRIDVGGLEHLRSAVASGGVLITPNHSVHYDTYALYEAADRLRRPFYVLTAWQVFAMSGWLERWNLRSHGCFSIDREGADLKAFRRCVEVLARGRNPLVVYPEGDIYHLNDRVTPFREGAAAVALAGARRGGRPIACVPCAIMFRYTEDPTPELLRFMDRLERHAGMEPQPALPLRRRVCHFAEELLARKETEYLGGVGSGSLAERQEALTRRILDRVERRAGITTRGTTPDRVKDLRRAVILQMEQTGDGSRADLERDLEDLFFVLQLYSYPPDYLGGEPSVERLAETLDKLEEDVLGAVLPSVRGRRRVVIRFGEAIPARPDAGRRAEAARLTGALQGEVQRLLDEINREG
jgi:1-acyl-sn-glycerol-3-phosphate acyltransferase